eukprot:6488366-Amphidinium_carterae.1
MNQKKHYHPPPTKYNNEQNKKIFQSFDIPGALLGPCLGQKCGTACASASTAVLRYYLQPLDQGLVRRCQAGPS